MTIQIQGISSTLKKPGFYGKITTTGASGLGAFAQKLLLIGRKTSAGSKAALSIDQVFSDAESAANYGPGSIAHLMVMAARSQNKDVAPYVITMGDAADSTAASGKHAITGTAFTTNGSLVLRCGRTRLEIGIVSGDTPTVVAARAAAAVNAATGLPVTAAASSGEITYTAKNKGTSGNSIRISATLSAAGCTIAYTAMAGGATDPDIQTALDAVYSGHFDVIAAWDSTAGILADLKDHLQSVSSPTEQRPGRAFCGIAGASKDVAAQVTLAAGVNYELVSPVYYPGSLLQPCEISSIVAAMVAIETDPSLHFDGVELPGIDVVDEALRLSRTEQEVLLSGGVAPLEVNSSGRVEMVRLVTSRTTTDGSEDLAVLDTYTISTMHYVRQEAVALRRKKFPRAKMTGKNLASFKLNLIAMAKSMEDLGILENVDAYKDQFAVVPDPNVSGRALVKFPTPVVPGWHQTYAEFFLIRV